MNCKVRRPVLAAVLCSALVLITGCNRLKARDQLNKGVEAFKTAHYDAAIGHFQQATDLDPTLPMARLYLATAYAQQVIPNLQSPENMKNANLAIQNFQMVLNDDPKNVNALKGIASLYFNTQQLDKAKDYQNKVLAIDPSDSSANYTIGVIDWTIAYKTAIPIRQGFGLKDDGTPIKDKKACAELAEKNGPLIDEGMSHLMKAVQLKPDYDDAMAYINLMYRRKANDAECGDEAASKADVAEANEWVQRDLAARKANELKANQQTPKGIVLGH
jgi:tetratricopeptide (TPR) repeat protein